MKHTNYGLTQSTLFDKGRTTIVEHIKNIYATGELSQEATCRKFRQVRIEGNWGIPLTHCG